MPDGALLVGAFLFNPQRLPAGGANDPKVFRRFVIVAIAFPAAVVLIDHLTWTNPKFLGYEARERFFLAWMVIKTAAITSIAGRTLGTTMFGWLLLVWCMALLDIHTYWASNSILGSSDKEPLANTLLSAQVGFLFVWAVLGWESASIRIAGAITALGGILYLAILLQAGWLAERMLIAQFISAVVIAVICGSLRITGFRLIPTGTGLEQDGATAGDKIQFGIRDLLLWTAALAPLLVVLGAVDWLIYRQVGYADLYPTALISSCVALTTIATIWLALGQGSLVWRSVVFSFFFAVAGKVLTYQSLKWAMIYGAWGGPTMIELAIQSKELWIPWFVMMSGLLAAMLLFFRAAGFRLAKARI